jgi:hypothetical protein
MAGQAADNDKAVRELLLELMNTKAGKYAPLGPDLLTAGVLVVNGPMVGASLSW